MRPPHYEGPALPNSND